MSPTRRVVSHSAHGLLWLLAIVLIPLALAVGLGRELAPLLNQQKPAIERYVSEKTGLHIRVERITADWQGLSPSIHIDGVQIADPKQPQLTLLAVPRISTRPDWWASLRDLSPRLRSEVDGLALTLEPDSAGGVRVREFSGLRSSEPKALGDTLRWLFAQPSIALSNSALTWQAPKQLAQRVEDLTVSQFSRNNDYRAQVQFKLQGRDDIQRGVIRITGDPLAWQDAPWQIYLSVQNLKHWQPWAALLPAGWQFDLQSGQGELWLTGTGNAPTQATLSVQAVSGRAKWPDSPPYRLRDLRGVFMVQGELARGRLAFSEVSGQLDGLAIPMQRGHVSWQPDALSVALAGLSLRDGYALAKREGVIPASFSAPLQRLNPTGFVPRMHIEAVRENKQWALRSANAEFKALSWQAYDTLPGANNMAGWIQASATEGLMYLDARGATINAPQVFREVISADTLRGGVRWYRRAQQWHVDSDVLSLNNADAKARVQFALQLPHDKNSAPRLDLLAGLYDGQVASAWRYVPWRAAGDKSLAWLRKSLVAGQVPSGAFVFSGDVRPGRPGSGVLDMSFGMSNASLDYAAGWPTLQQLNGRVDIRGRALQVHADSGRIMGAQLRQTDARIADLKQSVLRVDSDLALDLVDLDRLLADSPLRSKTAGVAKRLAMRGEAQAQFSLTLPLASLDARVQVEARVNDATVGLAASPLTFQQVTGDIAFDSQRGLNGSLNAQLWDEPVQVTLASVQRANQWYSQALNVQAPVSADALSRCLGSDLSAVIAGSTPVTVALDLPVARAGSSDLRIRSDLQGLAILLPEPLAKRADSRAALNYQGKLGEGMQMARASIAGKAQAGLTWRDNQLTRLLLRVGLPGLAWREQPGIGIEASVATLQLNDWQALLAPSKKLSAKPVTEALPRLQQLSVQSQSLRAGATDLGPVRLSMAREKNDWLIEAEGIAPKALPQWPSTQLSARVKAQDKGGWLVAPLTLTQPAVEFTGEFGWGTGGAATSRLSGQVKTRASATLLSQLGLPASMESRRGQLDVALTWPGTPADVALDRVSGTLNARFNDGRLVGINQLNPLARVFGLVNASNLMRRLRFDFSDVTRKGLSFDSLDLSGELNQGIIKPADIDLAGPSLNLRGRGSVNTLTRQIDQRLRVDIPVSSAVPVVAGFLAGPVVGGALVAADLLLDKQLSRLTSVRYHVTGPWDNLRIDDEALVKPEKAVESAAQE